MKAIGTLLAVLLLMGTLGLSAGSASAATDYDHERVQTPDDRQGD
ncbi:MAG: hypothetical protein ONB06_07860 [candidate division KSB1 bacterium]|nr:hypothetical protein [candidate division KSB1 bacterium]